MYFVNVVPAGSGGGGGGGSSFMRGKERFSLSPTDISNGYKVLSRLALTFSMTAGIQGLGLLEESLDSGATGDYVLTVDGVSGHTKLTWVNDLATGGATPLASGDVLYVQYEF